MAAKLNDLAVEIIGFHLAALVIQVLPQRGAALEFVVLRHIRLEVWIAQLGNAVLDRSHVGRPFVGDPGGAQHPGALLPHVRHPQTCLAVRTRFLAGQPGQPHGGVVEVDQHLVPLGLDNAFGGVNRQVGLFQSGGNVLGRLAESLRIGADADRPVAGVHDLSRV